MKAKPTGSGGHSTTLDQANVLIDAHMLGQRETGNETYIANLLQQQDVFLAHGIRLAALVEQACTPADVKFTGDLVRDARAHSNVQRFLVSIPRSIARTNASLLHATYHAPFWISTPYVITIHDTSYRTHPRYLSARNVLVLNLLGYLSVLRARLVITVSQFCKAEVERIYPSTRGHIAVTPEAASEGWRPQPRHEQQRVHDLLGLTGPYLLCVGRLQPRKNPEKLVEAFIRVRSQQPGLQLVIVGERKTRTGQRLERRYRDLIGEGALVLPGYLSDRDLACLYSGCLAFVFPSLYEGFGLPVLEAMQCGAPVITSRTTALPEVAGDAALYVDPHSVGSIAAAVDIVIGNPQLRSQLSSSGLGQAKRYDWRRTAGLTAEAYLDSLCATPVTEGRISGRP